LAFPRGKKCFSLDILFLGLTTFCDDGKNYIVARTSIIATASPSAFNHFFVLVLLGEKVPSLQMPMEDTAVSEHFVGDTAGWVRLLLQEAYVFGNLFLGPNRNVNEHTLTQMNSFFTRLWA
jgi:hypothetical protein